MRAAVCILATLVLVPYALLALAFVLFGHALAGASLASFLQALLQLALWLIPWGLLMAAGCVIGLALLGAYPPTRRLGATLLCVLALASAAVIGILPAQPLGWAELTFLLPCVAVVGTGLWLALTG